jgi:hypothetical protein
MNLDCLPCRKVHLIALPDVERIVYALGALARDAWDDAHMPSGEEHPPCLIDVLESTSEGETYATHVEQAIKRRQESVAPMHPTNRELDRMTGGDVDRWQ